MRRFILLLALAMLLVPMSLHAGCKEKLMKTAKTKVDSTLAGSRCSWQSKIRMRPVSTFNGETQMFLEYYLRDVILGAMKADTVVSSREMIRLPDSTKFMQHDTTIVSDSLARNLAFLIMQEYVTELIHDNHPHYLYSVVRKADLQGMTNQFFSALQEPFCWYNQFGDKTFSALMLVVKISEDISMVHVFVAYTKPEEKPMPPQIVLADQVASLIPQKDKERHIRDFIKGQRCEILQLHVAWAADCEIWQGPFYFSPASPELPWVLIGTKEDPRVYAFAMPRRLVHIR